MLLHIECPTMNPQIKLMLQQATKAFQDKNFDDADLILKIILQVDSENFQALYILGFIKASQSKFGEATDYLARAARIQPNDASLQYNLAKALADLGNDKDALVHHKKAVTLAPNNPDAWINYGLSSSNLGRYDDALTHYDKALSLNPGHAEAWSNKGNALSELKRIEEALTHYNKALILKPDYAEAWSNLGIALKELKRFEEALVHYDKALSLKPDYAEAWSNRANILFELKRFDEALACYEKALSLKPDYAEAWSNKGNIFKELKRYEQAIVHYDKALSIKSDIDWVYGSLIHVRNKICSWLYLPESLKKMATKIIANERIVTPFTLITLNDHALLHKKSAEIFIESKYPSNFILGAIPKHSKGQKIKIGYFSADFHNHATGYLMAELFELHDKNKFELVGFSFGPMANDEIRKRLKKSFDQFIEVSNNSDMEIALLSRSLNIDIAVDLKGFTQDSRTGIFANRAAPIQVNYLGYPGTMGADYMDYIIADKTIIPVESQQCYSEKIVYLPNSYQVNDRKRFISERQFTRHELGLPENGFIFCCFNNNHKILPATFDGWMRILKAVDGSALFLYAENEWVEQNLRSEAIASGVDGARLVFAERVALSEHLARHRQADLFLDTLPYNAHTTASDALWAGLPVLTLMGESFASRVAASLLNAIGLSELITSNQEEYEELAIELAMNPNKLSDIKFKLERNRLTTQLFDTPLFTKNIEAAYIKIYDRYQNDLQPENIFIN